MGLLIQNIKLSLLRFVLTVSLLTSIMSFVHSQTDTVFWFAVPNLSSVSGGLYDRPTYLRFSSFANPATITLSIPSNSNFNPIAINMSSNTHQSINLNSYIDQLEATPANNVLNKGLKISSTAPITCYYEAAGQDQANPDIFTLKGKNALGLEFHIPFQNYLSNCSSSNGCANSSFDIIATENNTIVSIIPAKAIVGHVALVSFNITLNKGQVYSATASGRLANDHLGGSIVTSNKPIAITMKDDLANNIPVSHCQDLIGDQLIPKELLGTEYILVKGELSSGDKYYVCAAEANTKIYQDGVLKGNYQPGQLLASDFNTATCYLTSDKPICVLHVTGFGCETGGAIIPPITCTGSNQIVLSRTTSDLFKLILIVKSGGESSFTLNGLTNIIQPSSFLSVPYTANIWKYAKIDVPNSMLSSGSHIRVTNSAYLFHLAVINGQSSVTGCRYGFYSDFNQSNISWVNSSHNPYNAYCVGETIEIYVDSLVNAIYSWSGPNGFLSSVQNPIISNASLNMSGTYTATAITNGCETNSISINIFVEASSVTLPPDMVVNPNQAVSINAQGSFASAVWSNGFVGNPLQINPTMSNRYYVTVTSEFAGCSATDSIVVKVIDPPTIIKIPNEINICEGLPVSASVNYYYSLPECSNHFEYRIRTNSTWTSWSNYTTGIDIPTLDISEIQLRAYQLSCNNSGYVINSDTSYANWIIHPLITRESIIRNPFEDGICLGANLSLTIDTLPDVPYNIEFQYQAPTQTGWINGNSFTPTNMGMAWIRGRATAEGFGCISTDWEWFAWLVQPQPEIQGLTDQNICQGTNVEFLANVVDGYGENSYQWQHSFSGCNSWQNIVGENQDSLFSNLYNQQTTDYYRLLVQQSGYNCFDTSSCITVNVFDSPVVSINGNTQSCEGESNIFTVTAIGGNGSNSYLWYFRIDTLQPLTFYTSTIDEFLDVSSMTDSFYISVRLVQSSPACEAWSDEVFVRVQKRPLIIQQPQSAEVCLNNSQSLSVEAIGGMPLSYQWYGPAGLIVGSTSQQLDFVNIAWIDTGYYYCVVSNVCGTDTSSHAHITIGSVYEPATAIFGISSRCKGAGWNVFTANSLNETLKFWEIAPNEAGTMDSLSGIITWNPAFDGNATISYISSACGVSDTLTHQVSNLSPVGNPSVIFGDSIRCQGFGFSQYTTYAENAFSYVWQILNAGMSTINPATGYVLWDTNFRATAKIVVYAVGCNGASLPISKDVHFNGFVPIHSLGHVEICLGEPAVFTAVLDTVTPFGYQWFGPNGILAGESDSIFVISSASLSDTGAYYCRVNTYCGYSFTPFDTLTIHLPPSVSFTAFPNCMSENVAFTNTSSSDDHPLNAHWYFGDGTESTVLNPNHSYALNGSYTVNLTIQSSFGCIDSTSSNIVIFEKPFFTLRSNDVLCYESTTASITIDMTGGTPEYSYVLNNGTPQDTNYFGNLPAGKYFITVYDDNLCSYSDSVIISQPHPLVSSYLFSNVLCYADSSGIIELNVVGGTPPYSFNWSNGAVNSTIHVPTGTYDVAITDANGCTTNRAGIFISQPNPIVIDSVIVQRTCELVNDGMIAVYPTGGYGQYYYLWSNLSANDTIMNLSSGTYFVTITDDNNCPYLQSFEIFPNTEKCWEIWTSFSPNGDGINDEWNIRFSHLFPKMSVQVFNRWGALVYESIGNYKPWDGRGPGGKLLPPETYYFVVDLRDDVTKRITGTVSVIY